MLKILMLTLLSFSVLAIENDTMDIYLKSGEYDRPESGVGVGGKLSFYEFNMLREGMYLNLKNQKNIFDAEIFIRPSFVGFSSELLNLGFTLEPETSLAEIQKVRLESSKISITEKFFNFTGKHFFINNKQIDFSVDNFRFFCTSHEKFASTSAEGIIAGCLKFARLNSDRKDEPAPMTVNYSVPEEGKELKSTSMVKSFFIREDNIEAEVDSIQGKMNLFKINSDFFGFRCAKDNTATELDTAKLVKDCLNFADGKITNLNVLNEETNSAFHLDFDAINLREDSIKIDAPNFKFYGDKEPTTLIGLKADCARDENTDILDKISLIEYCIKRGKFEIHNILNGKTGEREDFLEVFKEELTEELVSAAGEETSINNIHVDITRGALTIDARIKFLFANRKLNIWGKINFIEESNEIEVDAKRVRLPFGVSSKAILLYFIKRKMPKERVSVRNDKIYIKV